MWKLDHGLLAGRMDADLFLGPQFRWENHLAPRGLHGRKPGLAALEWMLSSSACPPSATVQTRGSCSHWRRDRVAGFLRV